MIKIRNYLNKVDMKQVSKLWTYKEKENSILSCGSEAHFLFIFLKFCSPSSSRARTLNKAPNPEELRESVQGHLTFPTSLSSLKNDNRRLEKCTLICCFIQSCKMELKCILDRKCLLLWYLYHPCDEIMSLILLHINTRMHLQYNTEEWVQGQLENRQVSSAWKRQCVLAAARSTSECYWWWRWPPSLANICNCSILTGVGEWSAVILAGGNICSYYITVGRPCKLSLLLYI